MEDCGDGGARWRGLVKNAKEPWAEAFRPVCHGDETRLRANRTLMLSKWCCLVAAAAATAASCAPSRSLLPTWRCLHLNKPRSDLSNDFGKKGKLYRPLCLPASIKSARHFPDRDWMAGRLLGNHLVIIAFAASAAGPVIARLPLCRNMERFAASPPGENKYSRRLRTEPIDRDQWRTWCLKGATPKLCQCFE